MNRITDVRGMTVYANFPWHFVRVYTDDSAGLYGTGECFLTPGFAGILEDLRPLLLGRDISRPREIVGALRAATSGAGSVGGLVVNVITGIEAAVFDALGKRVGLPLSQLLGGRVRDEVRVYADCHGGHGLEALNEVLQPVERSWAKPDATPPKDAAGTVAAAAEHAGHMAGSGYDFLKFDLDVPGSTFDSPVGYPLDHGDLRWMKELVFAIRDAVGDDVDLAFDAHWRYRPKEMATLAREIEGARLTWLEDPVPATDLAGLRFIRSQSLTPVATGENHQLFHGFFDLVSGGGCDVVTPDLQKSGGLLDAQAVAALAERSNVPVAPHMIGSPLAMMTTAQLSSTVPNFLALEFHGSEVPFYFDMVQGTAEPWWRTGRVRLPDCPGIGLELDMGLAKQHVAPGAPFFNE